MRNKIHVSTLCLVICLLALMIASCGSTTSPVAFYTLNSLARMETEHSEQGPAPGVAIGIGPAQFPQFLKRPQIVTRSGPNRLNMSEFHQWGGSLDQDFLKVLTENISILMPANLVVTFPWKDRVDPEYWVSFDVQRFDGQLGDTLVLNLTWTIKRRGSTEVQELRRSTIQQPVSEKDYDALVSAHSLALEMLSREIAEAIQSLLR